MGRVGRPRSAAPPEQEDAPSVKLPNPPGRTLTFEQLVDYWQSIPEEQRQRRVSGYLFRTWPLIVRQQVDPNAYDYIDKYAAPPSAEDILNVWGSGKYKLTLTDNDRKKSAELCYAWIDLQDHFPHYPPTIPPGELAMDADRNRSYITWAKAKGFLKVEGNHGQPDAATAALADVTRSLLRTAQERPPQNSAEAQAFPKLLDMFKEANTASLQMVIGQMKQQDPDQFLKLLATVKDLMGSGGGNSSEKLLETVIKMQTDHSRQVVELQNKNTELLMRLVETKNGGSNGISQMKEMAEAFMGMKELFGGDGGGRPQKWWEGLLEQGLPMIPQVFREVGTMFKAISYASAMAAAAKRGEAPPPPPPPDSPAELPGAGPASNPGPGAPGMVQQQLAQFGGMIVNALNQGISGDSFAESIVNMVDLSGGKGMLVYMQIRGLGREGILEALQSHGPLWQQLQPLGAQLDQFIDEFLSYGEDDEAEQPAEVIPPPPEEKPRKRKVQ